MIRVLVVLGIVALSLLIVWLISKLVSYAKRGGRAVDVGDTYVINLGNSDSDSDSGGDGGGDTGD